MHCVTCDAARLVGVRIRAYREPMRGSCVTRRLCRGSAVSLLGYRTCAVFDSTVLTHASAVPISVEFRNPENSAETKQYGERWLSDPLFFPPSSALPDSPPSGC